MQGPTTTRQATSEPRTAWCAPGAATVLRGLPSLFHVSPGLTPVPLVPKCVLTIKGFFNRMCAYVRTYVIGGNLHSWLKAGSQ